MSSLTLRERDYEVKTFLCVVVDISSFCFFASSTTRKNSAISFSDTPFFPTNSDKMASNFEVVKLSAFLSTNSNKMVSKFEVVDVDSAVTNTSFLLFDVVEVIMVSFFLMPGLPDSSDSVTENIKNHLLESFFCLFNIST